MGRKLGSGAAPLLGELGPHLAQCGLCRGLHPYTKWHVERRRNHRAKIEWSALFHRATIKSGWSLDCSHSTIRLLYDRTVGLPLTVTATTTNTSGVPVTPPLKSLSLRNFTGTKYPWGQVLPANYRRTSDLFSVKKILPQANYYFAPNLSEVAPVIMSPLH